MGRSFYRGSEQFFFVESKKLPVESGILKIAPPVVIAGAAAVAGAAAFLAGGAASQGA